MQVSVINTTTATFSQLLVSSKYKCFQKLSKALQKRGSKDIQLLFLFVCILQCLKPKPGNSGFWRLYLLLGQLGVSGVHWVDNWTSNAFGLPSLPLRQTKRVFKKSKLPGFVWNLKTTPFETPDASQKTCRTCGPKDMISVERLYQKISRNIFGLPVAMMIFAKPQAGPVLRIASEVKRKSFQCQRLQLNHQKSSLSYF